MVTPEAAAGVRRQADAGLSRQPEAGQLGGAWVTAVRIAWLVVAILVLVLLVPELQATFETAQHLCQPATCSDPQISRQASHALREVGISLRGYATLHSLLVLANVTVAYFVAIALMLRRSSDRMVLLTAFFCVLFCTPGGLPIVEARGAWAVPSHIVSVLDAIAGPLLLYTFPTGSFVPRWSAALAALFIVMGLVPEGVLPDLVSLVLFLGVLVSILALQIYRYRRVSTPLQRQQTKVVVFGIGLFCATQVVLGLVYRLVPEAQGHAIPLLVVGSVSVLSPLIVLVSIGLAVLRHGLWDIDVLINRTLIYVTLTGSLILVYLGTVLALQTLFGSVIGRQSDLAVAVSTLVIAALFNPLRRRIQDIVSRTFYRRRYDASRVLGAFVAACRDETDLEALQSKFVVAVDETMHPSRVSLWLRTDW